MTSNGKQFTVTHEMLNAVVHDQRCPDVVAGSSAHFSKFAFVLFCYITKDWSLGEQRILFPSDLNVFEILRKQNSLFPSGSTVKNSKEFTDN